MSRVDCGASASEASLIVGPVYGLRLFTYYQDPGGLPPLRGLAYQAPWSPGENESVCHKALYYHAPNSDRVRSGWQWMPGKRQPQRRTGWYPRPCSGMEPSCSCGFYAYHAHEYFGSLSSPGASVRVPFNVGAKGVIEGYGRVVVGPNGFRAEKARIVALARVNPTRMYHIDTPEEDLSMYGVPIFKTQTAMLRAFPVENLTHLAVSE